MTDRYKEQVEDAATMGVRKKQITTVRYKVYIFCLGLFLFVFRPTFIGAVEKVRGEGAFAFSFSDPIAVFTKRGSGGLLQDLDTIQEEIIQAEHYIDRVAIEKSVVELLSDEKKQNTLINCLNNDICDGIAPRLMKNIKFLRVFLMIHYLGGGKMSYDQKTLLRNINEFLTKTPGGLDNGVVQSINFDTPRVLSEEYNLKELEIGLTMVFEHRRNFRTFLNNLEDRVYRELPVLYVIDSVNYDIVNYTQQQTVSLAISVYYFDGLPPSEDEIVSELEEVLEEADEEQEAPVV